MYEPTEVAHAARTVLRTVMQERLTDTEAKRVAMLYGLDTGRALSERQVAGLENVERVSVRESCDTALEKLAEDWRAWLLSLLVEDQPARWFGCDHCKNDCGYSFRHDADEASTRETQVSSRLRRNNPPKTHRVRKEANNVSR